MDFMNSRIRFSEILYCFGFFVFEYIGNLGKWSKLGNLGACIVLDASGLTVTVAWLSSGEGTCPGYCSGPSLHVGLGPSYQLTAATFLVHQQT